MFYDSSYVSDMYKISRLAHKAAKENLEEQRDRQEDYYIHDGGPGHHTTPTRRRASAPNFTSSGKHLQ
jgi:acetoin utilization deacetylase AcuC-like enzyme